MHRDPIYDALFLKFSELSSVSTSENYEIPSDPFSVYVVWSSRYLTSVSVKYTESGAMLTRIMSGVPASGEYLAVDGCYTFSQADEGSLITIDYIFTGIINAYQSLISWNDTTPDSMPALFLVPKTETNTPVRGLPSKWQLSLDVYLYVNSPLNPTFPPSKLLNPLLDEIENMLSIDEFADNVCTLGGLVSHAWIDGQIQRGEGIISSTEIAVIPINILVPA